MVSTAQALATGRPAPAGEQAAVSAPQWARQPSQVREPATSRIRRTVDTLPSWEPLPPGEILVNRSRER